MTIQKLLQIEAELRKTYFERDEEVHGSIVALLARQHVLLLGPPGTAKSQLVEDLCARIGGNYFSWLLTKFSTPEELFGPISLKALEQDKYTRIIHILLLPSRSQELLTLTSTTVITPI